MSEIERRMEDLGHNDKVDDVGLARVIGGSTMKLFGKRGTLKKASHRLYIWPDQAGDGSAETLTPSKVASEPNKKRDEMARLEKVYHFSFVVSKQTSQLINWTFSFSFSPLVY